MSTVLDVKSVVNRMDFFFLNNIFKNSIRVSIAFFLDIDVNLLAVKAKLILVFFFFLRFIHIL